MNDYLCKACENEFSTTDSIEIARCPKCGSQSVAESEGVYGIAPSKSELSSKVNQPTANTVPNCPMCGAVLSGRKCSSCGWGKPESKKEAPYSDIAHDEARKKGEEHENSESHETPISAEKDESTLPRFGTRDRFAMYLFEALVVGLVFLIAGLLGYFIPASAPHLLGAADYIVGGAVLILLLWWCCWIMAFAGEGMKTFEATDFLIVYTACIIAGCKVLGHFNLLNIGS